MSNLRDHAIRELQASGWYDGDGMYGTLMRDSVLQLVDTFSEQSHSGMSASLCVSMLEKILRFEPVVPLTGADDEWVILDYDDHLYAQNLRCSRVFKRRDGSAFDSEGKAFRTPDGLSYTSRDSNVDVTFPYTPHTEIVEVDE